LTRTPAPSRSAIVHRLRGILALSGFACGIIRHQLRRQS
jgi:hypothetical protein